ncbi:carbohydrate ABC transporter permease [Paenibacillus rhizovicinus]|uniref:Carbohydrate ABC transporter permease n=1 Tax=Paenibacillus rhizovicinus TaxID=2704463 RepID=A0A6C0P4J8_9BACL|nr:carbohydrate ABC transporter permease [Paenibacillus rhizovicinus]QHW32753.1 carbohydrate ABC transporter permease [Paenibacillus rhizovicinus]
MVEHKTFGFRLFNVINYFFFSVLGVICLVPFLIVLGSSFESEPNLKANGFALIPKHFTVFAYQTVFQLNAVMQSFLVSITVTVLGTLMALLVTSLLAYPLAQREMRFRGAILGFVLLTMLFSGGLVPWYILITKYLHLKDTLWVLIVPYLVNPFNMFVLKSFFETIPKEIVESARMDGAGYLRTFTSIIIPLSTPGLATIGLFYALNYWNDWWLSLNFIESDHLVPVQLLLKKMISNLTFISSQVDTSKFIQVPANGVQMATTIISIGPIILVYPYIQRYFVKGLTIGSIKG